MGNGKVSILYQRSTGSNCVLGSQRNSVAMLQGAHQGVKFSQRHLSSKQDVTQMFPDIFTYSGCHLKINKPSKYKCSDFLSKTHVTFLLWLITFEPLEQKQSYIPLLKVLMCGMNA